MTEEPADPDARAAADRALVAELAKKTGVSWLSYDGEPHAVWHLWFEDALYVVSGGDEQQLPGIGSVDTVEVTMRSKENGGRLVTWVGRATAVPPGSEAWGPVTSALVADRLNLPDLGTAADEWAARSLVTRIEPTGEMRERPGALDDDAHAAPPVPTEATTRGPLPRVLHRRVRRRPRLS